MANVPAYNLKITGLTGSTRFASDTVDREITPNAAVSDAFNSRASWKPLVGELNLRPKSIGTVNPSVPANSSFVFSFSLDNRYQGQPAPVTRIFIQYCSDASSSCYINATFTSSTSSSPLFIQSQKFTILNISQTSSLPGQANTIKFALAFNVPLKDGRTPKLRITNLYPLIPALGENFLENGAYVMKLQLPSSSDEFSPNSLLTFSITGTNVLDCCSEGQTLCGPFAPVISVIDELGTCSIDGIIRDCSAECLSPCDKVEILGTSATLQSPMQVDCPRFISANISQV